MAAALAVVELLTLAALAAYVQTMTGFAMGLVMMGGIALGGLLPLPDAAVLVSVLTLVNALVMLARGWHEVAWREFGLVIVPSLAALFAGYALLVMLAGTSLDWIRLVLGIAILASSIQLMFRPHPLADRSPALSFVGFATIGGLMGGLFSTSGPPLVYHLYRQPLSHASIRQTLVLVFAVNAVVRLATVAAAGQLPPAATWWTLLAVPVVVLVTWLARRWPSPFSVLTLRRGAFVLLLLSGLFLAVPAIRNLVGAVR
jgi:uncharacterized membrane protein YfcA